MNLKSKKKITHMVYSGLGGASKVGIEIAKQFSKNKSFDNSVIFNGIESLSKDYLVMVNKFKIKYFFSKKKRQQYLINLKSILYSLKKIKPDVIISHEIALLAILIFKFNNKVKVISAIHTPFNSLKEFLKTLIILTISDKIIFVTKKKDFHYKFLKFLTSKIMIIENGIPFSQIKKNKVKARTKNFIIGKSIRFVNQKKPELIIDVCKIYREILLKKKIVFSIAGSGPNFKKFKLKVKKNKLQKLIKLEGYLFKKDLIKWYAKLDLFVNFSIAENLSISILEAMSIPLPILATKIDGNQIICKKKFYGPKPIILTENDPEKIYENIIKLYNNKNLRNKISQSAYKNFKLFYTSKKMANNYYKLI